MPLPLSSIAIEEKNKLATDSVFLACLRIIIPGITDPVRLVNNSENITWQHPEDSAPETWAAFPFQINEIADGSSGEVPRVDIQISNISRVMDQYLQYYDDYIKANGFSPVVVSICVVNTKVIAADPDAAPEVEHTFELKQPKCDAQWATFTLSAGSPYLRRFPQNRILRNHCRYKFKGADGRCGYTGLEETTCDHTLIQCRERNNSIRFGNAPGVGLGGFDIT
jgi:phage-related protein